MAIAIALALSLTGCTTIQEEPAVPPATPVAARILWGGNAETGDLSEFQNTPWNNVGNNELGVAQDVVRSGRYSIKIGIDGPTTPRQGICCGSRNELVPRFRELTPDDDLYFSFSTYLVPGFPVEPRWQVIVQFKQNFDGAPPVSLDVERGSFWIAGGAGYPGGPRPFSLLLGPTVVQHWEDWVLHIRFSPDPTVGHMQVWRDGRLVLPSYAPPGGTMYPNAKGAPGSYMKIGYYRKADIGQPGTLYFDDIRIGTSLDVVRRN